MNGMRLRKFSPDFFLICASSRSTGNLFDRLPILQWVRPTNSSSAFDLYILRVGPIDPLPFRGPEVVAGEPTSMFWVVGPSTLTGSLTNDLRSLRIDSSTFDQPNINSCSASPINLVIVSIGFSGSRLLKSERTTSANIGGKAGFPGLRSSHSF
jgi:hypothetical protein